MGANVSRRAWVAVTVAAVAALLLSACGFQLRGEQDYVFKRLAVVGALPPVQARLERMVQGGSNTRIVKPGQDPDATLTLSEVRSSGVLTINAQGVAEEYVLDYTITYRLVGKDGALLLPPSSIRLNRSMTYSTQYALAKSQESDLLFLDMQNDAVDQLMRRLAAVRSLHPVDGGVRGVSPRAPLPPPPI